MTKLSVRARAVSGAPRQRSVAAAARAAAKRAEKAGRSQETGRLPEGHVPAGDVTTSADARADREEPGAAVDAGTAEGAERAGPSRDRSGLLSAVLAVLVVVGLVATVLLGQQYRDDERTQRARAAALAAARRAAPVILSYDYRHLDRDFAAARAHLTGSFLETYRRTTTNVVAPTAAKYQGVVKATVAQPPGGDAPAASVVSASPDKVVVLLFMNQVTNSTRVSGPRIDLNRVRMTLTHTSGGWKVSAVDAM